MVCVETEDAAAALPPLSGFKGNVGQQAERQQLPRSGKPTQLLAVGPNPAYVLMLIERQTSVSLRCRYVR